MTQAKLLIADDEKHVAEGLQMLLAEEGFDTHTATDGREAWEMVQGGEFGLVLADLKMPKLNGLELFAKMREAELDAEVIIITGAGTVDSAVEAMRNGAYDFLTKPLDLERLKALIPRALEKYSVKAANRKLRKQLDGLTRMGDMIGQSEEMREVFEVIEAVAQSNVSVLIIGESGTGKELVAHALHDKSDRRKGPFIALNCGAFPREILENELFGHEKGAFTGALNEKAGAFEFADGGTLFLDEVAEMEPDVQVKFLRALEQRAFRRLGGKKEIDVDIRVLAATNRNVEDALKKGDLRDDLYHRLAVIPIYLPPLRDRAGDVRLISEQFLHDFAAQQDKKIDGFTEGAIEYMETYTWPGNVRELRNAIERAVILARDRLIDASDLQPRYRAMDDREVRIPVGTPLEEAERLIALKTFAFTGGDYGKTARILGVDEKELRGQLGTWIGKDGSGDGAGARAVKAPPASAQAQPAKAASPSRSGRSASRKGAGGKSTRSAPAAKKSSKRKSKPKAKSKR
ncbi:MAG TPA: sigma-54 dependent transcriptional regulator [Longimicrobiales bacterium]|nr:sigma-54 dependent transcriptional regulator [Longimicrobiales bacterium]